MALILEFLYGSIKGERRFDGNLIRVGRDPQGEIAFDFQKDPAVSFNHAIIEAAAGRYELKDLGSTNGTFVDLERIEHHVLYNQNEFRIGSHVLMFIVTEVE